MMCLRAEGASESVIYKIEVPANRYDLLCMEGLVMGLLVFQQKCSAPVYRRLTPVDMIEVYTKPATADVRPFVIGAVLRGVTMTPDRYQSFIDLQVCRTLCMHPDSYQKLLLYNSFTYLLSYE